MEINIWKNILSTEFVASHKCWEKCQSFCCNWTHPSMDFQFLPRAGTLFYIEEEYNYLKSINKIHPRKPHKFSIDFANKKTLTIYCVPCSEYKDCNVLFERPLSCRLYPFLPLINLNGDIEDLGLISVYDITINKLNSYFINKGQQSFLNEPYNLCIIRQQKDKYLEKWQQERLFTHHSLIMYLRAAYHIYNQFCSKLDEMFPFLIEQPSFWRAWELAYLRGKFLNKNDLSLALASDYKKLSKCYGVF